MLFRSIALRKENVIGIVTHSEFIEAILAIILMQDNLTPRRFASIKNNIKISNASMTKIQLYNNGNELKYRIIFE